MYGAGGVIHGDIDALCVGNDLKAQLNANVTSEYVTAKQQSLRSDWGDDYNQYLPEGYEVNDTSSWLLNVLQSLALSVFWWQPIAIYFLTWLKLWAFTWNLEFSDSVGTVLKLAFRVCRCCKRGRAVAIEEMHSVERMRTMSTVGAQKRPLDVMSFYGNQHMFLKLDHELADAFGQYSDETSEEKSSDSEEEEDDDYGSPRLVLAFSALFLAFFVLFLGVPIGAFLMTQKNDAESRN